ncbi:acyl-CoA thioester hydrolase/thioesterase-3 [Seinonella peptonophila]|uniref:Acyl-CoA thioester hydrolase/thioesterase-3 n=1 Tax=Seinonella peptonophila TaxID=112248 RepID=A0A1M5AJD9_9BACL|nr:acyl-CoA thioesterase [Seinonella peptonophila]SHF30389.1 acyl-CoA thioester hydrolase/thioesterase-3 [Seinonella peptonophila]
MKTEIEIEVRPTEIDVMGHVNNAKYIEYLEWGREDWYNKAGIPFDELQAIGIGTVVARIEIDYRKEARLGERLLIKTQPHSKGRTSYLLQQQIFNQEDQLVTEAIVTGVTISLEKRKSVPLPTILAEHFTRERER